MGSVESKVNVDAVKKEVATAPVVMWTKPKCGFCDRSRKLLADSQISAKEIDLDRLKTDKPKEATAITNGLVYTTRQTSVPQIFICGKFIGGFTELSQLKEAGRLLEAVAECSTERD